MPTNNQYIPKKLIYAILFMLGVLWLASPHTTEKQVLAPQNEQGMFGFGDTRSVGQSFISIPGLWQIIVPISAGVDVEGPLILHIRQDYFGPDIRTSLLFRPTSGDNVFTFDPIFKTQKFVWVLEAPNNPDQSFFVYREIDGSAQPQIEAFMKGKPVAGDFGFIQVGQLTNLERGMQNVRQSLAHVDPREIAVVGIKIFALFAVLFFLSKSEIFKNWSRYPAATISVLLILMASAHVWYAYHLPFINDEGAYLQDAWQASWNFLPLRDFLTKGPVYIGLLKVWQAIVPDDPVILRGFSTIAWGLAGIMLYFLARLLELRRPVALLAVALLLLSPVSFAATTPLLLQIASTAIGLAALTATLAACRRENQKLMILGAGLMVVAYLTRASSAIYAILGALLIFFETKPEHRYRMLFTYVMFGIGFTGVVAGISVLVMGFERTLVLFNLEAFLIAQQAVAEKSMSEPFLRQLTEGARLLWRGGPWFIAAFILAPVFFLRQLPRSVKIFSTTVLIVILALIYRQWSDMGFLLPPKISLFLVAVLGLVALGVPAVIGILQTIPEQIAPMAVRPKKVMGFALVWIIGLMGIYGQWFRFVDSYIVEFLPPLSILAAVIIFEIWHPEYIQKTSVRQYIGFALLAISWFAGIKIIATDPHTGTFSIADMRTIRTAVQSVVPVGQPIFTAQASVTAIAERPIVFGYSHSGWYLYERKGLVPNTLRQLFFTEPSMVTDNLRDEAQYIVLDDRTQEVYFNGYPDRQEILKTKFEPVNPDLADQLDEPILIFQRK